MEAIARLRNCPVSPRKMRLVANQIRNQQVNTALQMLKFNQKQIYASKMEKLLLSAISNWQQKNEGVRIEDNSLVIKQVFVDSGRQLKRLRTAPQGRAHRIRKRSNHVTIIIDQIETNVEANNITEEKN
jgi:large subunit ribosomal protein L22